MIPSTPKAFDPSSKEGDVFRALSKLGEDYYVFHSLDFIHENDVIKRQYEREMDFVVVHPEKGILVLEVKAGENISYHNGAWWYSSGKKMERYDGPYKQASTAMHTFSNKIKYSSDDSISSLFPKLNFYHAVVFPDMTEKSFGEITLPPNATRRITVLAEDLVSPGKKINEIFSYSVSSEHQSLNTEEFNVLLEKCLCPEFHLVPSSDANNIVIGERMNQLLYEQYRLLDFLDDQDTAVINGAAGTGKTMVALEKARRHSINGERVLFLCYNRLLCSHFVELYKECENKTLSKQYKNVQFFTINKLALEVTGKYDDYNGLLSWLKKTVTKEKDFGFKHVIVDEGQDFGLIDNELKDESLDEAVNNCSIVNGLQEAALANEGTFYLFYDKYQIIQGFEEDTLLPSCIEECDCRLSLKTNCRNTAEIAKTSITPIKNKKNKSKLKVAGVWTTAHIPTMHLVENRDKALEHLNKALDDLEKDGIDDIVILSMNSIENSLLSDSVIKDVNSDYYLYCVGERKIKVSTCRRFKGLEAEAIVLIDVDSKSFSGKKSLEFYVGTSRAKFFLHLICLIHPDEYYKIASEINPSAPKRSDTERMRDVLESVFAVNTVT